LVGFIHRCNPVAGGDEVKTLRFKSLETLVKKEDKDESENKQRLKTATGYNPLKNLV